MIPQTFTKAVNSSIYNAGGQTTQAAQQTSFGEFLLGEGLNALAAFEAIRLYNRCLPLR